MSPLELVHGAGRPPAPETVEDRASAIAVADVEASRLFDEALTDARISTKEAAFLLGVSDAMIRKMRSADIAGRVTLTQLLLLPPAFHIALHRRLNARYGFGRAALARLLEAVGELTVVQS